ncbi:hypothetical protein EYF80_006409 [Liparis tanakae]|uniref:Uncharacterized protein n=1 Tax=Liparis tanakae TaxID=230148 RepID=A0A4Z2J178_9TELE|nr:hypothetical protein EYF80_006409 [Liparis tanakae]
MTQDRLLGHHAAEDLLVLGQHHGADQGGVAHVAHGRLGERLKVLQLLLHVFGDQAPVVLGSVWSSSHDLRVKRRPIPNILMPASREKRRLSLRTSGQASTGSIFPVAYFWESRGRDFSSRYARTFRAMSAMRRSRLFFTMTEVRRAAVLTEKHRTTCNFEEEDGAARGGAGKQEGRSGPSGLSSVVPLLRLSTQPSLLWSSWRRPGGSGSTSRVSRQSGSSWRRRAQQRYSREVGAEQDRITFMLLFAAVEHAIG